jgi:hypothetical protein
MKLLKSNLVVVTALLLPVFATMWYMDYQQRLLESNPEVIPLVTEVLAESKQLAPIVAIPDDRLCLASNLYFEARSEGHEGMVAVANVTTNRVADPEYPKTVCEVVYQRKQFSWTNAKVPPTIDEPNLWEAALRLADKAMKGKLPNLVGDARFYYNPKLANPAWAKSMEEVKVVSNHRFLDYPEKVATMKAKYRHLQNKPLPKSKPTGKIAALKTPKDKI